MATFSLLHHTRAPFHSILPSVHDQRHSTFNILTNSKDRQPTTSDLLLATTKTVVASTELPSRG